MLWNISKNFFSETFLPASLPLRHRPPFPHHRLLPVCPHLSVHSLTSTRPSSCRSRASPMVAVPVSPQSAVTPCKFQWNISPSVISPHFFAALAFFSFTSLLEYNCFTMVCLFLLYNKVNQLYIYIYPYIPSLLSLPPTLPIPPL